MSHEPTEFTPVRGCIRPRAKHSTRGVAAPARARLPHLRDLGVRVRARL